MKKDEIIELLKEQNKRLSDQAGVPIAEITPLKEVFLQKGEFFSKQERLSNHL